MTTRGRILAACAALLSIMALAACENSPPSRAASDTPAPMPQLVRQSNGTELLQLPPGGIPGMTTTPVSQVEMPGVLEATGQIAFDDRRVSTIVSRVTGRIEETRVSQWDNVRRGEPIVELYSPDLMTAEAEYMQARTTVSLSGSPQLRGGTLAPALLSAARRKLELLGMSESDIASISAPSPSIWIRAPIGGTVIDNKAVRGSQVNPGDILFTLGTLNDVWITADIYEDDLSRVKVGQQMQAVTTAYPDETFSGFIARISPNIDATTHTLQIRCEVANPDLKLKPQMLARIKIVTRPGYALVVPEEALVFDTNRYYAFVETTPGSFERRAVTISSWREEGLVRVIAGLNAGDRVVQAESIQINALWHEANGESS